MPWGFGKLAGAPEGAGLELRLTGLVEGSWRFAVVDGRARVVEELPASAGLVEELAFALALVAAGRLDDERALEEGILRFEGEWAHTFLRSFRLFP